MKHIVVRFTIKEAENLLHGLGNTTDFSDALESIFDANNKREKANNIKACLRAETKIRKALIKIKRVISPNDQ